MKGVSKKRKDAAEKASRLLAEDRFQALFSDPDFAIAEKGPGSSQPIEDVVSMAQKTRKKAR